MANLANDQVILVTGATDGIGKATAFELARLGARVLLHGRNEARGQAVLEDIRQKTGNDQLEFFLADLSSQKQVRELAANIQQKYDQLNVLINNAGVFMPARQLTENGIETTFAVNILAPFLLSRLLLDRLVRNAPARVINVTSSTHWSAHIDWGNLQGERYYNGYDAYALSKLGDILLTYHLARQLKGSKVTSNCVDPGVINTKMLREGWGSSSGADPKKGAENEVYLATSSDIEHVNGQHFRGRSEEESSPQSFDRKLQEQFWMVCENLTSEV